jgi:hypothetical protein
MNFAMCMTGVQIAEQGMFVGREHDKRVEVCSSLIGWWGCWRATGRIPLIVVGVDTGGCWWCLLNVGTLATNPQMAACLWCLHV